MKRIVIWVAATVTIVVLLFGYHTSTNRTTASASRASSPSTTSASSDPSTAPSGGSTSGSSSGGSTSSSSGSGSSTSGTKTYSGSVAQTRWGPLQVEITVTGGKITKVDVPTYPNGNPRDEEINAQALPILVQETIDAQSADIDMVSGATVTSGGYLESLQAALDLVGK